MAAQSRASKVRAAAATLSARHGTTFNAMFDRGARWDLDWVDGPTGQIVEQQLSTIDTAGAQVRLHRNYSLTATALAVIRAAAGGENVRSLKVSSCSSTDMMWKLDDVEHPERPANDREQQMVTALLAAATSPGHRWASETQILELVATSGLAWLLGQETPGTETAGDAQDVAGRAGDRAGAVWGLVSSRVVVLVGADFAAAAQLLGSHGVASAAPQCPLVPDTGFLCFCGRFSGRVGLPAVAQVAALQILVWHLAGQRANHLDISETWLGCLRHNADAIDQWPVSPAYVPFYCHCGHRAGIAHSGRVLAGQSTASSI